MFFDYKCKGKINGHVEVFGINIQPVDGGVECELHVVVLNSERRYGRSHFNVRYADVETLLHDLRNGWLYGQPGAGSAYIECAHDLRIYAQAVADMTALL